MSWQLNNIYQYISKYISKEELYEFAPPPPPPPKKKKKHVPVSDPLCPSSRCRQAVITKAYIQYVKGL